MQRVVLLCLLMGVPACVKSGGSSPASVMPGELHTTIEKGDADAAKRVLEAGASPDEVDQTGQTALLLAVRNRRGEIAALLLDAGANANLADTKGATPLQISATFNDPQITRLLLDHRGNPNLPNEDGYTPLMVGCVFGFTEIVRLMVAAGGDMGLQTTAGKSAWHIAARKLPTDCFASLIKKYSVESLERPDSEGLRPIQIALSCGSDGNAQALLLRGCNPTQLDSDQGTLLHLAAAWDCVLSASELVKHRAVLEALDADGETALHSAATMGSLKVGKILLGAGVIVDKVDKKGQTPLHHAALMERAEFAKLLLAAGANPRVADLDGDLPADLARSEEMRKLFKGR